MRTSAKRGGEPAGQPLSRDRKLIPGADAVRVAEGDMFRRASASVWTAPGVVVEPGMRARSLYGNRENVLVGHRPPGPDGPRREGEEP